MTKIGRNEPCPCGSGKKFKKCHGFDASQASDRPGQHAALLGARAEAHNVQRLRQQGLGRPIISAEWNGKRFVAVKGRLTASPRWKTFHDFLFDYIKGVLGSAWGNAEIAKPAEQRHPIIRWYQAVCYQQRKASEGLGRVQTRSTGAAMAYLHLAYDLYALEHNIELQQKLLHRLRNHTGFSGARYEVQVASVLVRAGFDLVFEDESDRSSSHCEFTATHQKTGRSFSVEAKRREGRRPRIGHLFNDAQSKHAQHPRVIFIDLNLRDDGDRSLRVEPDFFKSAQRRLRQLERQPLNGGPRPPAYVFLTNAPWDLYLEDLAPRRLTLAMGFQISKFYGGAYLTLRQQIESREAHTEMHQLIQSMEDHSFVPSTFDGQIPEFAFDGVESRLLIGSRYGAKGADGVLRPATLVSAVVNDHERQATCVFKFDDGTTVINFMPLSDPELNAWKRHPDTFFGVLQQRKTTAETPLELYDFFYDAAKKSSKERLLGLLADQPDIEQLGTLGREELASIYAERLTGGAMAARPNRFG